MTILMRSRARRALQGAVLGAGAPLGWLFIQGVTGVATGTSLSAAPALYFYMLCATSTVFALFGYVLGMHEEQLARANTRLESESVTDPVTGVPNRRYFDQRLNEQVALARRTGRPVAVALFDIDYFKTINDIHGHVAGDAALHSVASALEAALREGETLARVGGDEFGVILADEDLRDATLACERLRLAGSAARVTRAGAADVSLTLSGGVAASEPESPVDATFLYDTADAALYDAKSAGRNVVASRMARVTGLVEARLVALVAGVPEMAPRAEHPVGS